MYFPKLCFVIILISLATTSFSENSYGRLKVTATNQKLEPLANVSFFIECSQVYPWPRIEVKGKTFMCSSDNTGTCFPEVCYGCQANSSVNIYARYFSEDRAQNIPKWVGYQYDSGLLGTCSYITSPPSNDLRPFTFDTYDLKVSVANGDQEPFSNALIALNSPNVAYWECKTNENGECNFYHLPSATYSVVASSGSIKNQTTIEIKEDRTVELNLIKKSPQEKPIPTQNKTTSLPTPSVPNETTKNKTLSQTDWFEYLLNETDGLIGQEKEKQPIKMKLIFVPIGYTDDEYDEMTSSPP